MRFIPTKVHGIIDYVAGLVFIASPWLFGFADGGAAQWVPIVLGVTALIVSIFTDYQLGLLRWIPMPMHLGADVFQGLTFIASPWLFGFANQVYLPHVLFGLFAIGAGLLTQPYPYPERATGQI